MSTIHMKRKYVILVASIIVPLVVIAWQVVFENGGVSRTDYTAVEKNGLNVGFFSPKHVDDFVAHIHFSMINVYPVMDHKKGYLRVNLNLVRKNLEYVKDYDHLVHLDLGPTITNYKQARDLTVSYENSQGVQAKKVFEPLAGNKIREIVSDLEIKRRLEGLPELIKTHGSNVGTIFIVDEPYLNGVSKEEINRAIRTLKQFFGKAGIDDLEYGVVFASAMFDADFAEHINRGMIAYVEGIDNYYRKQQRDIKDKNQKEMFSQWVEMIKKYRLTTYDSANNVFLKGGIPEEADVIACDFYLSTLLLDLVHENTLSYFSKSLSVDSCAQFENRSMSRLKQKISFFQDGPVISDPHAQEKDTKLLDMMFQCRMEALMTLQDQSLEGLVKRPKRMLIGESSANGVLELDSRMTREQNQPVLLVEKRVLDEVKRSFEYYARYRDRFDAGLMYFLYPDSYDHSINLFISGIKGTKSVTAYIYDNILPPKKRDVGHRALASYAASKEDGNTLIIGFANPGLFEHPLFSEAIEGDGFPLFPETVRTAVHENDATAGMDQANTLFDRAEVRSPDWFHPPKQATFSTNGYLVRYYQDTKNYIAIKDSRMYVFGAIFGGLVDVGNVAELLEKGQ